MSRTRAAALALVNWNGVFYERYLLDRHVTALEGANGAGKTTVMIAAYVVLLPDMSRLRFTNLGETGATGGDKGIWGRLGEPGRPSYAAIDFTVAGAGRLVAGVHLEKKGEPSVEPTPFIVYGLDAGVRLQDLLLVTLGERELVPELPELRENAARLGGRLQVFGSARDYFAALFDGGVTPLRLATDEERNKLNEMLRTSMTGGISRALTSELRDFLLKEEGGLADTLQRMKANLAACRRTRIEVQEARKLEGEIGGVLDAGRAMFAAAWLATRERATDGERRVAEALGAKDKADAARDEARRELAKTVEELAGIDLRRVELERALAEARAWHARVADALAARGALDACHAALEAARARAGSTAAVWATASAERDGCRQVLRRAQEDYQRAARGLAEMQRGIEELHRRAGAYLQVMRRMREAAALLSLEAVSPEEVGEELARARDQLAAVDEERREVTMRLEDAEAHARRHGEVMAALRALARAEVTADNAPARADEALRRHRADVALAERAPAIERELAEARRLAAQQARVRERAAALEIVLRAGEPAPLVIRNLLEVAEGQRDAHETGATAGRLGLEAAKRDEAEIDARQHELSRREPLFRELAARAQRLSARLGTPVSDMEALGEVRAALAQELGQVVREEDAARAAHERLLREARELLAAGGPFAPELLRLKDELGAELVAAHFDDVALEEAGPLEARLGALAQALVVDDPRASAAAIAHRAASLPDVLLVAREADLAALGAGAAASVAGESGDVIVEEGLALRASRIPARPRLGRRARETRAAELRAEAEAEATRLEALRARRRQTERLIQDGEALLAGHEVWLAGDPAVELDLVRRRRRELDELRERMSALVASHEATARALRPRIKGLRELLGEAWILDEPDQAARTEALHDALRHAREAAAEVARAAPWAAIVERERAQLERRPLSEAARTALAARAEELVRERKRLDDAVDALAYVDEHREALAWSEAPGRLALESALAPALEAQLREAEAAERSAERAASEAEARHDEAKGRAQDAEAVQRGAEREHAAARARFDALEVSAPSEEMLSAAALAVAERAEEHRLLGPWRDELLDRRGTQRESCKAADERVQAAEERLTSERREAEPAMARWERLQARVVEHDLLASVTRDAERELAGIRGHPNLVQEAGTRREVLVERLRNAQGGPALLTELEVLRDTADAAFADAYLELWLVVRDWLRRRLPAQVAEVDDPHEALLRLRDQLGTLDERLTRQEADLRGESKDVANGIDVQVRKARGQVNRLNANIAAVSFGSIEGIRVRLQAVERMEQVLRALREGTAQGLLFQEDMPFEDALDEIFRRYAGGRTGGQRLLDYREYVHLQVEIRRRTNATWEIANPTRLSTGEAIGVGAALMMVVLTEWERDATMLRGKRAHGSLRFLFLDEANRLSHDNLGVLFDLCQTLDLQLLIAAPEVARAEGNTTYRLVRVTDADGREEVRVSGRYVRPAARP